MEQKYYETLSPQMRLEFELYLANITGKEIDKEMLKANYLKRSKSNNARNFNHAFKMLDGNNYIELAPKEKDGKMSFYYSLKISPHLVDGLEKLMEQFGFIKVTGKKYKILVD
jgi:hypothetical protein